MTAHGHDRIQPHDLEVEQALLGAIMVDPAMFDVALEYVVAGDFYSSLHEAVFLALGRLYARSEPLDKVALAGELRARGMLDKVGGMAYLSTLMDSVPTTASTAHYADKVREKSMCRAMIRAGTKIVELGYEDDIAAGILGAEQELSAVTQRGVGALRLEEPEDRIGRIATGVANRERQRVILSPWAGVNRRVGGFAPGELIVVPAPPMTGKTGLGITLADFIAETYGPVLLASIEMGDVAIDRRRIAQRSTASARAQRLAELTSEQRQRVAIASRELAPLGVYVTGQKERSIAALYRNAREIIRRRGLLAAVVIDHVLFLDEAKPRGRQTKHEALDEVYQRLLAFGSEFACPVFALIHLNRTAGTGRPTFASLLQIRDGGNVEGHAHTAIFPYREDPMQKPTVGELVVVKSRDGDTGHVPMYFDGARALWCEAKPDGFPITPWFERSKPEAERAIGMEFQPSDDPADLFPTPGTVAQ
jgi:replicative DNA helicase